MDSDVLNVVVALVVIYGLFRWWSKPATEGGNAAAEPRPPSLSFRPRNVTATMVTSVQSAFPQEPRANIHYDLLKTGNVQVTSNKLIEKGFLPTPPPEYFAVYPETTQPAAVVPAQPANNAPIASSSRISKTDLISRFGLENRLEEPVQLESKPNSDGKSAWLDTAAKRQASLQEKKAQMVLAARKRLLEKQEKQKQQGSAPL